MSGHVARHAVLEAILPAADLLEHLANLGMGIPVMCAGSAEDVVRNG